MKLTRKCFGCKQDFRKEELVEYFSSSGKTSNWYCKDCLAEKQSRERFITKVCQIFGLQTPGPLIWTQRKHLRNTYGYTDDAIVDCLDYLYNVEKKSTLKESLGLVAPWSMEKTKKWKAQKKNETTGIAAALANTQVVEEVVTIREHKKERKKTSLEDGLFDD